MANSISVMAGVLTPPDQKVMKNIPSFYTHKLAFGPTVAKAVRDQHIGEKLLDWPMMQTLMFVSMALGKRMGELVVLVLDRPRNQKIIDDIRAVGPVCAWWLMATSRLRWHLHCPIRELICMSAVVARPRAS